MLCPVPEQSRYPLIRWGSATGAVTLTVGKNRAFISNALYTSAKGLSEETRRIHNNSVSDEGKHQGECSFLHRHTEPGSSPVLCREACHKTKPYNKNDIPKAA